MRYPLACRKLTLLLVVGLIAAFVCGCTERAVVESDQPARPTARIIAYINVSSGCQEPTIELLEGFRKQYPGRIHLGIVDFGDEGTGTQEWKEAGYDCLTIEVNNSDIARFMVDGQEKVVAFRQPVGFWWTHEDLKAAVAAAVSGTLQTGTEEEAFAGRPPREVKADVVVEEVKREGKIYARVLIDERPAIRIQVAADGQSPVQRAETAAEVLRAWISVPVAPNQIDRHKVKGGWAVRVDEKVVAIATEADAKAAKTSSSQLAKKWLVGVRRGIAIAARPPDPQGAAGKTKPAKDPSATRGAPG